MRRVRLSAAVSIDGYIAASDGTFDWIPEDPDIDFGELTGSFDTVLLGRKSYEVARAAGQVPDMPTVVFSRSLSPEDAPDVTVSSDILGTVTALKQASGGDIWLYGGGELFRSMLELGLVDAVQVAIVPVLLGEGIPLLPRPAPRVEMKLVGHRVYPKTGTVLLDYDRIDRTQQ